MATIDQNFEVYAAAQKVVSAYLQAHNNTLVESGDPLVAAIVALNSVVNGLPEYTPPGVITATLAVTKFPLVRANGGATGAGQVLVSGTKAAPSMFLATYNTVLVSNVQYNLPLGATIKGVADNTITKAVLTIDVNGIIQSIALTA